AFRETAFRPLVLGVDRFENGDAVPQAGGSFLARLQDAAILLEQFGALGGDRLVLGERADLMAQLVDAAAEILQRLDHGLDALGAQTEFFDQDDRTMAAAAEAAPSVAAFVRLVRLGESDAVIALVAPQQGVERLQVVGQAAG